MLSFQAMIGCLLIPLFALLCWGTDSPAPNSKHRWIPTDSDNPHWKMSISNLAAQSTSNPPYADFTLHLLPGKFTPLAICHAHVVNPNAITSPKTKPHPLPSTDWIDCSLPDIANANVNGGTNNITNATVPIPISSFLSNHTNVSFRWIQLPSGNGNGNGNAVVRVQSNMSFVSTALFERALDSLVGVWPPRENMDFKKRGFVGGGDDGFEVLRGMARAMVGDVEDDGGDGDGGDGDGVVDVGSLFVWQQGTFNIPAVDMNAGENYTGKTNLSTVVDWIGVCNGLGQCQEKM